ncbi:DUF4124 domain-containing protein [Halomonas sp. 18H]|uniref:DUF4124 domain-containing protein n=1 Tax=Halomonas almeriensis TaxID=308163 RepID=UPI00222F6410|nr:MULTISPECIES: DUF4124 domain-containing protein [Halomonas]MCW4152992.1 DUF4124 domain-containing protein [Halomonas sp. 18H]MDN3554325.1 DUF4124 domain-containing protein [Halomonas almeriensis]
MKRTGRRGLVLCLTLFLSLAASAETLYRTTDAQGLVRYSDDPASGGELVELAPISIVPARSSATSTPAPAPQDKTAAPPYARFAIDEPADQSTLPNGAAGNVMVRLAIRPALRAGHRWRLRLDGEPVGQATREPALPLTNLARGRHRLEAELLGQGARVLRRSAPVILHVRRASVPRPGRSEDTGAEP